MSSGWYSILEGGSTAIRSLSTPSCKTTTTIRLNNYHRSIHSTNINYNNDSSSSININDDNTITTTTKHHILHNDPTNSHLVSNDPSTIKRHFRDRLASTKRTSLLRGGPACIAKQHTRGSLTARERIDLLFNDTSFRELDTLVMHRCQDFGMRED
mmetsp:Transcript_17096/g.27666  ORF Transcript_17096/g.27666 Transcript_17096/m.27666 type:complete len:156 (+) Transcript_17096:165-632(+)